MLTLLFIKYLLMTNISKEPFATLIVPVLLALLISQHRGTNKIFIKIGNPYCLLLMIKWTTFFQTDCSSFVCWDNYFVHSTNKISVKIRKPYDFMAGTVQNGLIYLYELNSTGGLNNRTLDTKLRSSLKCPRFLSTSHETSQSICKLRYFTILSFSIKQVKIFWFNPLC